MRDVTLVIWNSLRIKSHKEAFNKLSLYVMKTNAMVFHMRQKQIQLPKLSIYQTSIEFVSNLNFLGIAIDTHLNWSWHINLITNKVREIAGILNKLKYIFPQSVLVTIHYSLIQCNFNYGILYWGHQTQRLAKTNNAHNM